MTRRQRTKRPPHRTPKRSILPLTLAALVLGVVGVIAFAAVAGPRGGGGDVRAAARAPPPTALVEGRTVGRADAPVTIEIWSDFQCPACAILALEIEPRLITDYVVPGTARLVYRDFAFLGEESLSAAVAARSAEASGRFWAYHDLLFANQAGENRGGFDEERLLDIADAAGVPRETVAAALVDPLLRGAVRDETVEGRGLGVDSTPTSSSTAGRSGACHSTRTWPR